MKPLDLPCLFTSVLADLLPSCNPAGQLSYFDGTTCVNTLKTNSCYSILNQNIDCLVQVFQLKSGPYFNKSNLFTKIYMFYYTTYLYLQ
jgi:hypothetical protein